MQVVKHIRGHVYSVEAKRGVGGNAFPGDYNWTCPVCKRENRAFEESCGYCEHEEFMRTGKYLEWTK